jgi:hypothetical protein
VILKQSWKINMPGYTRSIKISDKKGNKPWLRHPRPYSYAVNSRVRNRTILIICEGQTEEQYFKSFPVLTATIKPIHTGSSKTALVESVAKYKRGESYDEIWCVFDFDVDPVKQGQNEDFNRAILKAKQLGYHCAYSNDAFELWFILHYQLIDQQQHRDFYYQLLSKKWGINYLKEGKSLRFASQLYPRLLGDRQASQQKAIEHGRYLLDFHAQKPFHLQNPVTTVFQLVEKLNEYCRK